MASRTPTLEHRRSLSSSDPTVIVRDYAQSDPAHVPIRTGSGPSFTERSIPSCRRRASHGENSSPDDPRLKRSFTLTTMGIKRDNTLDGFTPPSMRQGLKSVLAASRFNILLIFVPISWSLSYSLHHANSRNGTLIFISSFFAIISLANLRAWVVDELTARVGRTLGALLSTSFGNVVPLIIGIVALKQCNLTAVHNSLMGSIISNLLLVLGMAFIVAGVRTPVADFLDVTARVSTALLLLSVVSILIPGIFHLAISAPASPGLYTSAAKKHLEDELSMSRGVAVILIVMYASSLVFQLWSHAHMFSERQKTHASLTLISTKYPSTWPVSPTRLSFGGAGTVRHIPQSPRPIVENEIHCSPVDEEQRSTRYWHAATEQQDSQVYQKEENTGALAPTAPLWITLCVLVIVTGLVINNVRFLVNSMNGLTNFTGGRLSRGWVSLILLPIVGNVADLVITVGHSVKKDLDLAISLAFGASVQMALFVIPFLVLYAWIMHKPLTLLFDPFESIILVATTLTVAVVVEDGRTNWLEGVILLALYFIVALAFWYYPGNSAIMC